MDYIEVNFTIVHPAAKTPIFQTEGSVGADLMAIEDEDLEPGQSKLIRTGLKIALPAGVEMQIRPRSGLALKHNVTVLNSPGTIDSDYRGEIGVLLINHGNKLFRIKPGDRIAQAVLNKVVIAEYKESEALPESRRGSGGFGSTGIN